MHFPFPWLQPHAWWCAEATSWYSKPCNHPAQSWIEGRSSGTCMGETAAAGAVLTGIPLRGLLGTLWTVILCPVLPARREGNIYILDQSERRGHDVLFPILSHHSCLNKDLMAFNPFLCTLASVGENLRKEMTRGREYDRRLQNHDWCGESE